MDEDWKWFLGIAASMFASWGAILIGSFRNLSARITKGNGELHARIDNTRENYVRRDDFSKTTERIERAIEKMESELRDHNTKVLQAIAQLSQNNK